MSIVLSTQVRSWADVAMRRLRLTPSGVALSAVTAASAAVVASKLVPQPVHAVLALVVLVVAPGVAFGRVLRLADALTAFVTGVAFSFAVLIAVATLLLYLQLWSESAVLAVMTSVTAALAVASSRGRQP